MTVYAYHGTTIDKLPNILKNGLVPGAYSSYRDRYSVYDDGKHIFYSDDSEYVRGSYGNILLRFVWPNDSIMDKNVYDRLLMHQFVCTRAIPAKDIEIELSGQWLPLNLVDIEIIEMW